MAVGDLSAEQARFASGVASATGLPPVLLTAWVGCETGWNVTKPDHNYLNVGPGHRYRSVDEAVHDTARLISSSSHYAGIRAAIPAGPVAVVDAIEASPWGSNPACIRSVLGQLPGGASGDPVVPVGWGIEGGPGGGDSGGGVAGQIVDAVVGPVLDRVLEVGLGLVLTAAALGLIALGLNRLTGVSPKDALGVASSVTPAGRVAASLAR